MYGLLKVLSILSVFVFIFLGIVAVIAIWIVVKVLKEVFSHRDL